MIQSKLLVLCLGWGGGGKEWDRAVVGVVQLRLKLCDELRLKLCDELQLKL